MLALTGYLQHLLRRFLDLRKRQIDLMSQQGKLWVMWADQDWVSSRILYLETLPQLWPAAGLLGHKSLEQYLKAFLRSNGEKTEWGGDSGHNLIKLEKHCKRYDRFFENPTVIHRFQIFYDIYRGWRYPARVRGSALSPEVEFMGDNHLLELDETVAMVRPRIDLKRLGLPLRFEECYNVLPDQRKFVEWARKDNNSFAKM